MLSIIQNILRIFVFVYDNFVNQCKTKLSNFKIQHHVKRIFNVPKAVNEPVKSYAPGSPERAKVAETYKAMWNAQVEVPLYIGMKKSKLETQKMSAPRDHQTHCRCLSSN